MTFWPLWGCGLLPDGYYRQSPLAGVALGGPPFPCMRNTRLFPGAADPNDLPFLKDLANLDEKKAFSAMLASAGLGYFDYAIEIVYAFPSIISERLGLDTSQISKVLADTAKSYGRARLGMEIGQTAKHFARLLRSKLLGLGVPLQR